MEKFGYDEWKRVSMDLKIAKQSVEEMSKLYILAHERVKTIIRKVQTNQQYDPTDDCESALEFIKSILQRLADRQNDEYLSKLDQAALDRYEQSYFNLMQLIRVALATQSSKNKINVNELFGVKEQVDRKDEFSLRGELKKSEQRMVRTKSGHRITKKRPSQNTEESQFEKLIEEKDDLIVDKKIQTHNQNFMEKRERLEKIINDHIDKQGFSVNFKKKYSKLDEYLQERKQFADLIFCQKYYDDVIEEGRTRKNQPKVTEKKLPDMNKIFPEFNVKTKYLKKQVKQNILQVIFDVKKQLLNEFHLSNVAKMEASNENGMMKLVYSQKNQSHTKSTKSESSSTINFPQRFRATNRTKNQFFRKSVKSLGNTVRIQNNNPSMKKLAWEEPTTKEDKMRLTNRIINSKMPNYSKKINNQ